MSKLRKIASNEMYYSFISELSLLNDNLDDLLQNAKNNDEIYNELMKDENFQEYQEIMEMNRRLSHIILKIGR